MSAGSTAPAEGRTVEATQAALAAEHATIYGYGVAGARLSGHRADEAHAAVAAHRARRDALDRGLRERGAEPRAAAPAYRLPFSVHDAEDAARLAVHLEERVAAVYVDLVGVAHGALRRSAVAALREASIRAVRWRGGSRAFPGLRSRPGPGASGRRASGS